MPIVGILIAVSISSCDKEVPTAPVPDDTVQLRIIPANDLYTVLSWDDPPPSANGKLRIVWGPTTGATEARDVPDTVRMLKVRLKNESDEKRFSVQINEGNEFHTVARGTWRAAETPAGPSAVRLMRPTPASLRFSWTPPAGIVQGYMVIWTDTATDAMQMREIPPDTAMTITGINPSGGYEGSVVAKIGGRYSRAVPILATMGAPPTQPSNLTVAQIGMDSVLLRWTAPPEPVLYYDVTWDDRSTGVVLGSRRADTASLLLASLSTGTRMGFSVIAIGSGGPSTPAVLEYALSARRTTDAATGQPLRIYERASSYGAGMMLDPARGGPTGVSLLQNAPGVAQIAMHTSNAVTLDSLVIGPIYAIPEYRASFQTDLRKIDTTVYVGTMGYRVNGWNDWTVGSLNQLIPHDGNIRAFVLDPNEPYGPFGFVIRTGLAGDYHYARVLLKSRPDGTLLFGNFPNRYLELEISWQSTPNLPYAKRVGAPAAVLPSMRRR